MASPESVAPVQFLLDALRKRVAETSIRTVAGEVGLSPNAIRGFLAGASPRRSNIKKLAVWFQKLETSPVRPTPEVVAAALAVLVAEFPAEQRAGVQDQLLTTLQDSFIHAGLAPPRWLETVPSAD